MLTFILASGMMVVIAIFGFAISMCLSGNKKVSKGIDKLENMCYNKIVR